MQNEKGFTLVELAIVLVIIGLIVGGVLVGQDLINTAERRKLISQVEKYQTAVNTFRNKYNALPGDMRNATQIWGAADADPTQCGAAVTGAGATCNGDGNGRLDGSGEQEMVMFWQQLGNAALIDFSMKGVADPTEMLPINSDFSFLYWAAYIGSVSADDNIFDGQYGHVIVGMNPATGNMDAMKPFDIQWIDEKKDDGKPGGGQVRTAKDSSTDFTAGCSTTDDPATAAYDLTVTTASCPMVFMNVF